MYNGNHMKLIFAQGNPEERYASTRHNVGWQVLDALSKREEVEFQPKPKLLADIATYSLGEEKILLIKPTTYYNETGRSLRTIVDFYKLDPASDVLVLHDELVLAFGTLRIREKGSDAGNNGIKSLNSHIGSDYHRLRIGIATKRHDGQDDADFVLSRFSSDEQQKLEKDLIPKSLEIIDDFISEAHQITSYSL